MSAGTYSSVMLMAGAGMLPDPPADVGTTVEGVGPALTTSLLAYLNANVITQYNSIVAGLDGFPAQANLVALGSTDGLSALTDSLPPGYTMSMIFPAPDYDSNTYYPVGSLAIYQGSVYISIKSAQGNPPSNPLYWSQYFEPNTLTNATIFAAYQVMGRGDYTKFAQIFSTAIGYVASSNSMLQATQNADVLATNFGNATGGMTSLTTGGLSLVTNNIPRFASDAQKLGQLINLSQLDNWGLPGEVMAQVARVAGGLPANLTDLMLAANVGSVNIDSLAVGIDNLDGTAEKDVYRVMTAVNGDTLTQVLDILGVTTSNITKMSDLLDPKKIFPSSYGNLLCPTPTGPQNIYLVTQAAGNTAVIGNTVVGNTTATVSVNTSLSTVVANPGVEFYSGVKPTGGYETLKLIIPEDQALANKAIAQAMAQMKNVQNSTLPQLSRAAAVVETNSGLPAVANLATPLPSSVKDFYKSSLANGSGPGGEVYLSDIIGVGAGLGNIANNYTFMANAINGGETQGVYAPLTGNIGVYTVMANTLSGSYTIDDGMGNFYVDIPGGLPGTGNYGPANTANAAINTAFESGLIPAANTAIYTISVNYANIANLVNSAASNIAAELAREKSNQDSAEINFNELSSNSRSSVMSFTASLHDYGVDVGPGGANVFLTNVANTNTLAGQSLISSLREGRNIQALQDIGIQVDTQL